MKAVVQRVSRADVRVDGVQVAAIEHGLLVLACITQGDTEAVVAQMALKVANLRIFEDNAGKINRSLLELARDRPCALVVSQFTLAADTRKGRRPSFIGAAPPENAIPLLDYFCAELKKCGIASETGIFGAHMEVSLVNDGPVTIWLDSEEFVRGHKARDAR